jgi:hypothetical protein
MTYIHDGRGSVTYTKTFTREELALKRMLDHEPVRVVGVSGTGDAFGYVHSIERRKVVIGTEVATYVHVVFEDGHLADYGVLVPLYATTPESLRVEFS